MAEFARFISGTLRGIGNTNVVRGYVEEQRSGDSIVLNVNSTTGDYFTFKEESVYIVSANSIHTADSTLEIRVSSQNVPDNLKQNPETRAINQAGTSARLNNTVWVGSIKKYEILWVFANGASNTNADTNQITIMKV